MSTNKKNPSEPEYQPIDKKKIVDSVSKILAAIGEDPKREGLVRTLHRVANAYEEILSGYTTDPSKLINGALFTVDYDEMVVVKDIEFYSLCEHHMLPFFDMPMLPIYPGIK